MCSTTLDFTLQMYALRPNLIEINLICYIPTTRSSLETWTHFKNLMGSELFIVLVFCVVVVVLFLFFVFVFVLCVVCPVFLVSLDCPFLIAASVFSSVYFPF